MERGSEKRESGTVGVEREKGRVSGERGECEWRERGVSGEREWRVRLWRERSGSVRWGECEWRWIYSVTGERGRV